MGAYNCFDQSTRCLLVLTLIGHAGIFYLRGSFAVFSDLAVVSRATTAPLHGNSTLLPSTFNSSISSHTSSVPEPTLNYYPTRFAVDQDEFEGVKARAFDRWKGPIPCFEPAEDWRRDFDPTPQGLLFMKPHKTGSSTSSGIHLRIARNQARRNNEDFPVCKSRFDHAVARDSFSNRDTNSSFLWTIVRDPTDRLISWFFHFIVSRDKVEPTDEIFMRSIRSDAYRSRIPNYYAEWLSTKAMELFKENPSDFMNQILKDYDFIGVAERMDESAVALSMLLGVPLADVLYLSAKGSGGFDEGGHHRTCFYIVPSFVSPGMANFIKSRGFQRRVYWDHILHVAANRSLDLTIERLGRERFEQELVRYKEAQALARTKCLQKTVFPCSSDGGMRPRAQESTDCLWKDSGCGYECLDEVATELGLWGDGGRPQGFKRI